MRRHEPALPNRANMTPLIDVVFLLIIFFLLVAQITRQRTIDLDLPAIEESAAVGIDAERRAVVNVVPRDLVDRFGGDYRLGSVAYRDTDDELARLSADLAATVRRDPTTRVYLRAARDEGYERVFPALRAAADADIPDVELVVIDEGDR